MFRLQKAVYFVAAFVLIALESSMLYASAESRNVTIHNATKQKLCLYSGYNLITCEFSPESNITVTVPTHVVYHEKAYPVSVFRVTDQGVETKTKDKLAKVRSNMKLCQKQDFSKTFVSYWEIKDLVHEEECDPGPRYKGDKPFGQTGF
jgi:hypothetical protein